MRSFAWRTLSTLTNSGRGSNSEGRRPFRLPPSRPSSTVCFGLAWKKQSPPGVAAAPHGLPCLLILVHRCTLRHFSIIPLGLGCAVSDSRILYLSLCARVRQLRDHIRLDSA